MQYIAETKKLRNEDSETKMMHKNETEKIIEKAMKDFGKKDKKLSKKDSLRK